MPPQRALDRRVRSCADSGHIDKPCVLLYDDGTQQPAVWCACCGRVLPTE